MKINKTTLKKKVKNLCISIWKKCLDCTNCQPKEIFNCETSDCPLWKKRPLKAKGLYTLIKQLKQTNLSSFEAKE